MNCFTCGTAFQPGARFCQQCGRSFQKSRERAAPEGGRDTRDGYPHSESLAQWNAMLSGKEKRALGWGLVVALPGAVLMGAAACFNLAGFLLLAGLVLLIIGATAIFFTLRVSPANYYTVAHSRDSRGQHRCIFCGNRGIWRKGEYRSTATHSHCSRCQKHLFTQ